MNSLRRTFGIAEPVRRGMELKIARAGEWRSAALGRSAAVSSDILAGRDTEISWEDVYSGMSTLFYYCAFPLFSLFSIILPSRALDRFSHENLYSTVFRSWHRWQWLTFALVVVLGDDLGGNEDLHAEMERRLGMEG